MEEDDDEMARVTMPVLIFLVLAVCVATYNTVTMISSYQRGGRLDGGGSIGEVDEDDQFAFDPLIKMPADAKKGPKRLFHVAVTANDSPYNRWQCRIMYYWYKKFKDHPDSEMGAFTRVLHSGKPDNFMHEIPTFVVDPLPDGEDRVFTPLQISCYTNFRNLLFREGFYLIW